MEDCCSSSGCWRRGWGWPARTPRAANNWPLAGLLAYRMGGQDLPGWKRTADGLSADIAPSETENFYYRATIACEPGLHVSVSSRVQKPRSLWRRLTRQKPLVWIKQSFVDLSTLCEAKAQKDTKGRKGKTT